MTSVKASLAFRRFSLASERGLVIENASFEVSDNGLHGLFGASGCGKSSLCKAATRLLEEDTWTQTGEILFNGQPIEHFEDTALRRNVLYLWQNSVAFPGTVLNNLELPQRCVLRTLTQPERLDRAKASCVLAGLPASCQFLSQDATTLSGGQLQRLAIARALVLCPKILILDEPTSALDPLLAAQIARTIAKIAESKPVLLVTHDMRMAPLCRSIVYLHKQGGAAPTPYQGSYNEVFGMKGAPGHGFAHHDQWNNAEFTGRP